MSALVKSFPGTCEIVTRLHTRHQECHQRASQSVWWPGLSKKLEQLVSTCVECCRSKQQNAEPLQLAVFPQLPWQKVGSDLFVWKNSHYLLVIDYFSRFIEIAKLSSETTGSVIKHMSSIFTRHGISHSSREFVNFPKEYGLEHTTGSPQYPQANGEAERVVQTVKALLSKSGDLYLKLALLTYRGLCQLPMLRIVQLFEEQQRHKQKQNFDESYAAHSLFPLKEGMIVWIPDHQCSGKVLSRVGPRSNIIWNN